MVDELQMTGHMTHLAPVRKWGGSRQGAGRPQDSRLEWDQMVVKRVKVAASCLTPCDPVDCSPPGSSAHGILKPGILAHYLPRGIFPTQRLNPRLLHCRGILYHPSHQGRPGFGVGPDGRVPLILAKHPLGIRTSTRRYSTEGRAPAPPLELRLLSTILPYLTWESPHDPGHNQG